MCDPTPEGECEVLSSHITEDVDVRGVRRNDERGRRERRELVRARLRDRGPDEAVREVVQLWPPRGSLVSVAMLGGGRCVRERALRRCAEGATPKRLAL